MPNKVSYEWDIETYTADQYKDILDHDTDDNLRNLLSRNRNEVEIYDEKVKTRLVLVRMEGNDIEGILDRVWAYVENGKLPEFFSVPMENDMVHINIKVPKKYRQEFEKVMKES